MPSIISGFAAPTAAARDRQRAEGRDGTFRYGVAGIAAALLLEVALFVAFATACSMPNNNRLVLVGALLQTQCLVAGTLSIAIAILLRQRFDAPTLTRWDEAVAFAGIGMLGHITTGIVQAVL